MDEKIPTNAVSIFDNSNGIDDFPVLKAFQQYIDAEQAKARKRMLIMGIFFGFVLVVVITVFVSLLVHSGARNQQLNDKLIEYALKDRDREIETKAAEAAQNARHEATLKSMSETLGSLERQLKERDLKVAELTERKITQPSAELLERERASKEEAEKLKKATTLLAREKAKIAAEKEELRQREIELQRRRLYPEYYEKRDSLDSEVTVPEPTATKEAPKKSSAPKAEPLPERETEELTPVEYFDVDDWLIPAK